MKKFIFLGLIIAAAGGLFAYFSMPQGDGLSQAEKEQALEKALGRNVDLSDKKVSENKQFRGKYAVFSYPGGAEQYDYRETGSSGTNASLESFSYDLRSPRVIFNYNVQSRANIKTFDDFPAYRLRNTPERGYTKQESRVKGASGVLFTKNEAQNSERSFFILGADFIYSFVLTGSDPDELDRILTLLVSSLEFPKE